jgi:hypothetical protein
VSNERVQLTVLTNGGAISELRYVFPGGTSSPNLLWETPWPTMDPQRFKKRDEQRYGPASVGKFLAGFTGSTLCLDYFGAPSEAEIRQGLCLHGEASVVPWRVSQSKTKLVMETSLPVARLHFHREISLYGAEPVMYVREVVQNPKSTDHFLHWVQHITLGAPFLKHDESSIALSAVRGKTWPEGYNGKSLLKNNLEFDWPMAPSESGGLVDLSRVFIQPDTGFVAAMLFDTRRTWAYVTVLNSQMGLLLGFCFPRSMYPWVTFWEENCARKETPWNGTAQARGIEIGTTPMPIGRRKTMAAGNLLDAPTSACAPARGELKANYAIFVCQTTAGWRGVQDVRPDEDSIVIVSDGGREIRLPATKLKSIARS